MIQHHYPPHTRQPEIAYAKRNRALAGAVEGAPCGTPVAYHDWRIQLFVRSITHQHRAGNWNGSGHLRTGGRGIQPVLLVNGGRWIDHAHSLATTTPRSRDLRVASGRASGLRGSGGGCRSYIFAGITCVGADDRIDRYSTMAGWK